MLGRRIGRGPARVLVWTLPLDLIVEEGFSACEKAADLEMPHLPSAGWDCFWLHQHNPAAWKGSPWDKEMPGDSYVWAEERTPPSLSLHWDK